MKTFRRLALFTALLLFAVIPLTTATYLGTLAATHDADRAFWTEQAVLLALAILLALFMERRRLRA